MKTKELKLCEVTTNVLFGGFEGEQNYRRFVIDASEVFADIPDAVPGMAIKPPVGDIYPKAVERDGDNVILTLSSSDCANEGMGEYQLTFSNGDEIGKTFKGLIRFYSSLVSNGEAPDPVADWVESANATLQSIEEISATAEELPSGSEPTAEVETVGGHKNIAFGIPAGQPGEPGKKGDPGEPGNDGVSPSVSVAEIPGGHEVTITDAEGTDTFDVMDGAPGEPGAPGAPGQPGFSPVATVTKHGNTAIISVTDQSGTTTAEVTDGNPESLIDDSSTATNRTWSAQKLNEIDSTTKSAITQKADIKATTESSADLYVCDDDGNVIAEFKNGHIITKNFDSSTGGLIADAVQNTADLFVCDANGNVIAEFANGHIKTKYFDSSNTATGGILSRVDKQTDGVYAACRYHQPNLSSKQFCLLLAGDSHNDDTRMDNMVDYLNSVDAFDAGIMLGDMSGNVFSDPITNYINAISKTQKPFLTVIGNHDVDGATSDSELYTKYSDCFQYASLASGEAVNGKCYYYKDFPAYKIRIIVMMQYDYTYTGNLCYGQDQIDWFVDVLENTPSDYGVIIAEHTNPSRYMTYNMDESVTSSTWKQSNYAPTDMSGDPVPDIVNAWINGASVSQTYGYTFTGHPSDLSVSADFSNRGTGEFITYLGGHWHMNVLGNPTGFSDQQDLHVPANGLIHATQGDMPRKEGTVSEDSLCALAVDRDKKTVKVFQIGAHYTKDAVDRQYFKYSYGT